MPETLIVTLMPTVILIFNYFSLRTGIVRVKSQRYDINVDPKGYWGAVWFYFGFYLLLTILPPAAIIHQQISHLGLK